MASEDPIVQEIAAKIEHCAREGISQEEVTSIYIYWPGTYDEEILESNIRYEGLPRANDVVIKHYEDKKDARLLDVGAGTGGFGKLLHGAGFTNIDALDASKYMLGEAKKKNVYKNLIERVLGADKLDIEDTSFADAYDGVVSSGCCHNGHIETGACFPELARIVKPGGWIILSMAEKDFGRYEPTIEKMESEGTWKVEKLPHDNYCLGHPGIILSFQVC